MTTDSWEWDDDWLAVDEVLRRYFTVPPDSDAELVSLLHDLAQLVKEARREPDPGAAELERARRAGWRRVAELEEIITVLRAIIGRLVDYIDDSELEHDAGVQAKVLELMEEWERVDPLSRDRWPRRT
jgi:hypothetical protein